jgi:hypothetical protein
MVQAGRRSRFPEEQFPSRRVRRQVRREELEGDFPLQNRVFGEENLTHPTFA